MREHIQAAKAFAGVSPAGIEQLAESGEWVTLAPGDTLYRRGDEARTIGLIVEGQLDCLMPTVTGADAVVDQLLPGDIVGETQLVTGGKRTTTPVAAVETRVICFPQNEFECLSVAEPVLIGRMRIRVLNRLRRRQLASVLPVQFGNLEYRQMVEIEELGRWVALHKGQVLFQNGDIPDGAYILVNGLLGVQLHNEDGSVRQTGHIRHGEVVGEMALLSEDPPPMTVYATRESDLLFFGREEFQALIQRHPRYLLGIVRTNIDRLRRSITQARSRSETSVTALVATPPEAPIGEFARRLAESLGGYCDVLHVDRKRLHQILGARRDSAAAREILANTSFPAWLCAEEGKHDIILLETDLNDRPWTEACIRQADRVLVVAAADSSPDLSEAESRFVFSPQDAGEVEKRLVLIQADGCRRPVGSAAWLDKRKVEMHHHVRMGADGDFKRLARFLTGNAICMALGGGGARGFAHIGVFRALYDEQIPIDIVGGTSMGAVIAAQIAFGFTPREMLEANRTVFSNAGLVRDMTLPLLAFTTGRAYAGTLKRTFGKVEIEDLIIPFFCVSSNISRAERAIHRRGLLWRKVRASSSVQGMFPPVVIDGDLHVDGAPFANLPADAMKTVCDGKVIAIDVSPPVDLVRNTDYGDSVSGWRILWKKWFPGKDGFRCADIGTIMQRSGEAVSMANQKLTIERESDFYLRLPVEEIGLFAFSALPKLEEIGYQAAKQKIAEWKAEGRWLKV